MQTIYNTLEFIGAFFISACFIFFCFYVLSMLVFFTYTLIKSFIQR